MWEAQLTKFYSMSTNQQMRTVWNRSATRHPNLTYSTFAKQQPEARRHEYSFQERYCARMSYDKKAIYNTYTSGGVGLLNRHISRIHAHSQQREGLCAKLSLTSMGFRPAQNAWVFMMCRQPSTDRSSRLKQAYFRLVTLKAQWYDGNAHLQHRWACPAISSKTSSLLTVQLSRHFNSTIIKAYYQASGPYL